MYISTYSLVKLTDTGFFRIRILLLTNIFFRVTIRRTDSAFTAVTQSFHGLMINVNRTFKKQAEINDSEHLNTSPLRQSPGSAT